MTMLMTDRRREWMLSFLTWRGPVLPDVGVDATVDLGEPAYVELSISRKALYTQSETPRVSAVVYDRPGDELVDYPVRFDTRLWNRQRLILMVQFIFS